MDLTFEGMTAAQWAEARAAAVGRKCHVCHVLLRGPVVDSAVSLAAAAGGASESPAAPESPAAAAAVDAEEEGEVESLDTGDMTALRKPGRQPAPRQARPGEGKAPLPRADSAARRAPASAAPDGASSAGPSSAGTAAATAAESEPPPLPPSSTAAAQPGQSSGGEAGGSGGAAVAGAEAKAEKTRPNAEAAKEKAAREGAAKEEVTRAGEAAERQKAAAQRAAQDKAEAAAEAARRAAAALPAAARPQRKPKGGREAAVVEHPPTAEDEEPVVEELQEERAAARGAREGGEKAAPRRAVSGPTRDFSVSLQQQAHASDDHAKFYMVVGGAVAFSAVVMQHAQSAPLAMPEVGFRASSGRAWQLWPARRSQGRDRPTGRPATASGVRASRLRSRRFHRLRPLR